MAKKTLSFSTLEEFEKAVSATKELVADKIAKIRVFSDEIVHISLDEQLYEKKEFADIKKDKLKSLLNTEIPAVISASLQEKYRQLLSMLLPGDEYDKKKEIRDEFDKKINIVKENLISEQIKQQTILKSVSKNNILDELKWDINYKCHDLEKGSIEHLRYATLQFICNRGRLRYPFIRMYAPKEPKTLTIDMHLEDLEQLIDDLNVLRTNLKEISSKE